MIAASPPPSPLSSGVGGGGRKVGPAWLGWGQAQLDESCPCKEEEERNRCGLFGRRDFFASLASNSPFFRPSSLFVPGAREKRVLPPPGFAILLA